MAERCNELAEKTGQRAISKETLRHFYNNYQDATKGPNRLLSDRVVFMLYKAYDIEPSFAPHLLYRMEKDKAEVPIYVKHCKQYITDVAMAKGIYRTDVARSVGLADSRLSLLFNDKLPNGLPRKTLESIREKYEVNFSPALVALLENQAEADQLIITGYVSLRSQSDRVWLHEQSAQKRVSMSLPSLKAARAIELEGQSPNPLTPGGLLLVYQESGAGVAERCIDQLCLVQTEDELWHIKKVTRSDKPNLYRLESVFTAAIDEREIKRAYKIEMKLSPGQ